MDPNDTIGDLRPERMDSRRALHRHRPQGAGALGHAVDDVIDSVGRVASQTHGFLTRQAEQRPKLMLACAAGLGFVLGGGLAVRTGALLVRVGGRLVLAHFVQRWSQSAGLRMSHPTAAGPSLE
jgi:hypothetical protein